jgi:hypothetical protein
MDDAFHQRLRVALQNKGLPDSHDGLPQQIERVVHDQGQEAKALPGCGVI